ncbi:MAG: triose-phosphate isomerase [Candidatus Moranbacteria bacterium]|nr:triose-phosphate isomerase [Candidatus Moranbacteria bacterium]
MKYVIANLKMNLVTAKECDRYLDALTQAWKVYVQSDAVKLIVCPSPFFMERFAQKLPAGILLGGQNMFWEEKGSFTGEVSPQSLQDSGVKAVICGHSERRGFLGETDEQVALKVKAAIDHAMTAIVCVGETAEEKEHDETATVIAEQIAAALDFVSEEQLERVIIAYEPRWAIGTGMTPSSEDIMQTRIVIQKMLIKKYGTEAASQAAILYGGSVNASLMDEVCIKADMSGVLVGKESLDPAELLKIIGALTASGA